MFHSLPLKKQEKNLVSIDLSKLFDRKLSYFNFPGSLTTPPCSEGVNWFVIKDDGLVAISETQFKAFTSIFSSNARPIQPVNNRQIIDSN